MKINVKSTQTAILFILVVLLSSFVLAQDKDDTQKKGFFEAVRSGQKVMAESFLDSGVAVDTRDDEIGATALLYACEKGDRDIIELLIARGANVNTQSAIGRRTPLHTAATPEIAKLLIEKGANVNVKGVGSITPLHIAVARGQFEMVELLLSKGAEPNVLTYEGRSPLDYARGNKKMEGLLKAQGAERKSESLVSAECREKLKAVREGQLKETCDLIEAHIKELEAELEVLCKDAGERILRTVDNVEGLYIRPPKEYRDGPRYYHEDDRYDFKYISPQMGRHYTFVEYDSLRKEGVIEHKHAEIPGHFLAKTPVREIAKPEAIYGITWKPLTDKDDQRRGLYGDELTVLDLRTDEVLATRKFYFYIVQDGTLAAKGRLGRAISIPGHNNLYRFVNCKNYPPGHDGSYKDGRPRDSYRFVSRVLRPKVMSDELAVHVFDLARGSGEKKGSCVIGLRFGPGIVPGDLQLFETNPNRGSLRIVLKGTNDVFACNDILNLGNKDRRDSSVFRFYDGTDVKLTDLLEASGIKVPVPPEMQLSSKGLDDLPSGEIHAVAVYWGAMPDGKSRRFQEHPQGFVDVRVSLVEKPIILLLMSYEPVEWRVTFDPGAQVKSVVLGGHYRQAISGLPPHIPVQTVSTNRGGGQSIRTVLTSRDRHLDFVEKVKQMLGREPITVQSQNEGRSFIVDGQKTVSFPERHGVRGPGPVTFKSVMEQIASLQGRQLLSSDKLTTTYCCSGAFTGSEAIVAYSRGKRYSEYALHLVKGASTITGHTDIGIMSPNGSLMGFGSGDEGVKYSVKRLLTAQSPLADGDVIGLAIDLDGSKLYVRRNGVWVNGDPNSGNGGIILKPGRDYVVAVTVGASDTGGESDQWTANFGATPFVHSIPNGYMTYEERLEK
jgi:hypothetical protein